MEEPTKLTITRNLYNCDVELDCMDCLRSVMYEFEEILTADQQKRVARWFHDRYGKDSDSEESA